MRSILIFILWMLCVSDSMGFLQYSRFPCPEETKYVSNLYRSVHITNLLDLSKSRSNQNPFVTEMSAAQWSPSSRTESRDDSNSDRFRMLFELDSAISTQDYKSAQELQDKFVEIFGYTPAIGPASLKNFTVAVAGSNGRVGSVVCRLLLRRGCNVIALVRNVDSAENYARLSYEIGAEEVSGDIQAPWVRKSVLLQGTAAMLRYGLGRLRVFECDVLDEQGVRTALAGGADAAIFCATEFDSGLPRFRVPDLFSPDALFAAVDPIFLSSARDAVRRREEAAARRAAGSVDEMGAAIVARAVRRRRLSAALGAASPRIAPFVLLSSADGALDGDLWPPGAVQETKRRGEVSAVAACERTDSIGGAYTAGSALDRSAPARRGHARPRICAGSGPDGAARGLDSPAGPPRGLKRRPPLGSFGPARRPRGVDCEGHDAAGPRRGRPGRGAGAVGGGARRRRGGGGSGCCGVERPARPRPEPPRLGSGWAAARAGRDVAWARPPAPAPKSSTR